MYGTQCFGFSMRGRGFPGLPGHHSCIGSEETLRAHGPTSRGRYGLRVAGVF